MGDNGREPTNVPANAVAARRDIGTAADLAVMRDFSERRMPVEVSRDDDHRFRNLVETTSDLVWEVDQKAVYSYISPILRDMLGYGTEEVMGKKTLFDLMPLKEANEATRVFTSAAAAGKPFRLMRNTQLHKDGRPVLIETSGVPFFDLRGKLCGYRGIHRDITGVREEDELVKAVVRRMEKVVEGTIQAITLTVEMRDHYIAGHQQRVAQLGRAIAIEMAFPYERIQMIRVAGLLHDLGKIFIPIDILNKPSSLTEDERAAIRSHPKSGYDVLKNVEFPWPIAEIVLQHHERIDGSGYPSGLKGEEILLEARILAVADVVEAMSSPRSCRPARDLDDTLREVARNKGVLYDSNVVEACLTIFLDKGFKFEAESVASPAS